MGTRRATLRHSRTTELCSQPGADPAAYLRGWRDVATLFAKYFHPTKKHAERLVSLLDKGRGGAVSGRIRVEGSGAAVGAAQEARAIRLVAPPL